MLLIRVGRYFLFLLELEEMIAQGIITLGDSAQEPRSGQDERGHVGLVDDLVRDLLLVLAFAPGAIDIHGDLAVVEELGIPAGDLHAVIEAVDQAVIGEIQTVARDCGAEIADQRLHAGRLVDLGQCHARTGVNGTVHVQQGCRIDRDVTGVAPRPATDERRNARQRIDAVQRRAAACVQQAIASFTQSVARYAAADRRLGVGSQVISRQAAAAALDVQGVGCGARGDAERPGGTCDQGFGVRVGRVVRIQRTGAAVDVDERGRAG